MLESMNSHILVIDDDSQIRALLKEYLAENGLRVSIASSGDEMSRILNDEAIDLVVLDLRLGGEDGMTIARSLRDQSAIPIVMLTGVRDEADRVMGLELGADDYLTKPFSPRELLARIRTVLRRTKSAVPAQSRQQNIRAYRFGEFELNLRTRRLKRINGDGITLTNGEFNLLAALLAAPESSTEPVSRNGLSLARNGCSLSEASISGSTVPTCYFKTSQLKSAPGPLSAPLPTTGLPQLRAASSLQPVALLLAGSLGCFLCLHSPPGLLPPSGSKRSTDSAALRLTFRTRPISSRSPPPFYY